MERIKKLLNKCAPLGLVLLVTFILFAPTIKTGYFADDFDSAVRYQTPTTAAQLFLFNVDGTRTGGSWRPLYALSMWTSMFFMRNPVADHVVSIGLYLLIIAFVYFIARRLFSDQSRWFAAAVTLCVALLPIHAEPVAWVSARADLLATLGAVSALFFWMRGQWKISLFCIVISILSKEVWVLFCLLIPFFPIAQNSLCRSRIYFFSGTLALVTAWFLIRRAITNFTVGGYSITSSDHVFGVHHLSNELLGFMVGWWNFGTIQSALIIFVQKFWFIAAWGIPCVLGLLMFHIHRDRIAQWLFLACGATLAPALLLSLPFIRPEATVGEQRYWFAPSILAILFIAHIVHRQKISKTTQIGFAIVLIFWMYGLSTNISYFIDAGSYRDSILASWNKIVNIKMAPTHVQLLPDSYHGVHLLASPFFERALEYTNHSQPATVGEWYQWCASGCGIPTTVSVNKNSISISSVDPRLFSGSSHGLRNLIEIVRNP
ncbi:MAG: hypothetical protein NT003_01690 [Candidatus Magasanikbacteria bacterium]|nr:hypothetical protein [Candidatus Magasanikbacteria bacterium]